MYITHTFTSGANVMMTDLEENMEIMKHNIKANQVILKQHNFIEIRDLSKYLD